MDPGRARGDFRALSPEQQGAFEPRTIWFLHQPVLGYCPGASRL